MKYVDDSKHAREDRMDEYGNGWLTERWQRTHNRTCPLTGRQVTLEDVERGMYYLYRIMGDSAYGYEVYPTMEYKMDLLKEIIEEIRWEPEYLKEAARLMGEAQAKRAAFEAELQERSINVITDENGLVTEYNNL